MTSLERGQVHKFATMAKISHVSEDEGENRVLVLRKKIKSKKGPTAGPSPKNLTSPPIKRPKTVEEISKEADAIIKSWVRIIYKKTS